MTSLSSDFSSVVNPKNAPTPWSTEEALELYGINRWGEGYFGINNKGNMCVLPTKSPTGPQIDMLEVLQEMKEQGIRFPAVIRFQDILRSQVISMNKIFGESIAEAGYNGKFSGVYPIKVNQMREVVEEIIDAGSPYNYGLEAGTKAELLAVLAMNINEDSLTILNGHKDAEYMKLALLGSQLGRKIIVVIEKFSELPLLLKTYAEAGVEPMIGIRAKLATRGSGRWADSGGDYAKFGLTIPEILQAVQYLKNEGKGHCLKLFHFHIGSQITDIRTIKDTMTEGSRIYSKLIKLGAPIEYFDVGGGVGVDYEGVRSAKSNSSTNYTLKDYVDNVVYILKEVCDAENVPHPNIVTETGRALTAHHSCVITNVFGSVPISLDTYPTDPSKGEHALVKNMRELLSELDEDNFQQTYNDAVTIKDEAISAFKLGILSLEERAKLETMFWKTCKRIVHLIKDQDHVPEELLSLETKISDQFLCNFSIFQSVPDNWAIGQTLPIVPIQSLDSRPTVLCTLADITCDSDGKIDNFIQTDTCNGNLYLHPYKDKQDYYIGVFLTGAYQDVMGDMHNMLGRLNEVHVFSDDEDPSDFYIEEIIPGNSSSYVLTTLQYNPHAMAQTIKKLLDKRIQLGNLKPKEAVQMSDFYEACLQGYTYLKN